MFQDLSTPLIADASLRLKIPIRIAPPGITPLVPNQKIAGHALPVRHYGSVDIFLEAMETSTTDQVLVIDNGGRLDEACIGDLTALEAQHCGLAGMIVWGVHRDTAELRQIALPIFTYGVCSFGPQRLDPREPDALKAARFGDFEVTPEDYVFADDDGVLFVPANCVEELLAVARKIYERERQQAEDIKAGRSLREQLDFQSYLEKRRAYPTVTFRQHLRRISGAIEE